MSDSPTIRRFVRSAWTLVAVQFVAAMGAAGVTIWAATEVRELLNQRDLLMGRVHELETDQARRTAAPPPVETAPEVGQAPMEIPPAPPTPPPTDIATPPPVRVHIVPRHPATGPAQPEITPVPPPPPPAPPPPPPPAPVYDPIRPEPQPQSPPTRRPRIHIPVDIFFGGSSGGRTRTDPPRNPNNGAPTGQTPPRGAAPAGTPQPQPTIDPKLRRRITPVDPSQNNNPPR